MGEITTGLRRVLGLPLMYDLCSRLAGKKSNKQRFADTCIRARPHDRVLDIGCGTASMLDFLPDVDYYGFDASPAYIAAARKRFGHRGTFQCRTVESADLADLPPFDIALALGVLHHLGDEEAVRLLVLARLALKPGGRLVTIDPCFVEGQSRLARYLISKDRGCNVRTEQGYRDLGASVFPRVDVRIDHHLLRIPYTSICMEWSDPITVERGPADTNRATADSPLVPAGLPLGGRQLSACR